jgi:hypothetical protein
LLEGDLDSEAFIREYKELRSSGMGIEHAMIFVGYEFRLS